MAIRNAYRQELAMVETVVEAERQAMLEANAKKWEELAKKRDQEENFNSEKRRDDYWSFIKEMDDLNRDFEELFRATNIKLENDFDDLHQELERIKIEVLMNREKLDYNYQILKKREDENMIIRSQQKRRINKLQDVINTLRKKTNDYQSKTTTQIEKLTDEVKKLSRSTLDLDNKCDHVSKCNDQKFHQVWDMNVERVTALLNKILDIDRVLYEQQLGIVWVPPEQQFVPRDTLTSYMEAVDRVTKAELSLKQSVLEIDPNVLNQPKTENYESIVRDILVLIEAKTGFLIENDLKTILEPYVDHEKHLITMDNIFSALHIKNPEDIDLLLEHFMPYAYCPICSARESESIQREESSHMQVQDEFISETSSALAVKNSIIEKVSVMGMEQAVIPIMHATHTGTTVDLGSMSVVLYEENLLEGECKGPPVTEEAYKDKRGEEEQRISRLSKEKAIPCQFQHPIVVNPVYVLKALNDFLAHYHIIKKSKHKIDLSENKITVSRLVSLEDIEDYWRRYRESFPEPRVALWDALMRGLRKYHAVLKDRKIVCEEVQILRQQNTELNRMFENYIDKHDLPYD